MAHELPSHLLRDCTDGTMICISKWAYNVTQGMFWVFALLGFCVAIFIATTRLGNTRAFGFASFTGMMGSIWFATMGLMSWWITTIFILVGVIGIVVMIMSKQ